MEKFKASCKCGAVEVAMEGKPRVAGVCHCEDCRDLLSIPFHAVNAWENQYVSFTKGEEQIETFQHSTLNMKKFFCKSCGDVICNSNGMDWRVFSQYFVAKSYDGKLPEELKPKGHFFYGRRIIDVADDLPKRD
jgi:hypothetical protein